MQLVVSNLARTTVKGFSQSLALRSECAGINCDVFHHIGGTQTSSSHLRAPDEMFLA
jgi:hypothetical protein